MPEALERRAEGFAKHLGLKEGSERWNRVKYGTMRKTGWTPSTQIKRKAARKLLEERSKK